VGPAFSATRPLNSLPAGASFHSTRSSISSFRKHVRDIVKTDELTDEDKGELLLQAGVEWFGVEMGALSKIDLVGAGHRIVLNAGPQSKLQEGEESNLSETYCRETIIRGESFVLENAEEQGWAKTPTYQKYDLSCYFGRKLIVNDRLYGTVFFGGREPKDEPLCSEDREVLRLIALLIERILEKRRRQRVPNEAKYKYELLLKAAPNAIILADIDTGRVVEANQRAAELIGVPESDIVGCYQTALHPDGEADRYQRLFRRCCRPGREGVFRRFEDGSSIFVQTNDGEKIPVEISAATLEVADQRLALGIFRDITEQRQRKERLERQDDLFDRAQEIADVGAWEYDVREDALRWTPMVYRIYDRPPEKDLAPGDAMSYYHPDDRPRLSEAFTKAVEEGVPYDLELRLRTENGEERWVRTRREPQWEEGEVLQIRGTVQDITDRRRRERVLRERQEKIEALYEATCRVLMADSLEEIADLIHELLGNVFDYPLSNTGFLNGQTIAPEQTVTDGARVPSPEPQPEGGDSLSAKVLQAGETVLVEDASTLDNNVEYGDLRSMAGVPIGEWGVVVIGKTEIDSFDPFNLRLIEILSSYAAVVLSRLNRERALREAKEEAEEAARLKSAMLANMSHEIRTPLTSIIGFAEALGEENQQNGTSSRFAELIEKSGRSLLHTLDGVLNLSKLEAGRMELEAQSITLTEHVQEVAEEFRAKAEEKGLCLQIEADGSVRTWASVGGVQIVLQNLISNAVKYTETGSVHIQVWEEESSAAFAVEDTGIGMDEDRAEQLFEPFRQASEGIGRAYEGTGLGLAVTKKAVDQMGGNVEVDTAKGEGSRFTVRLPNVEGEMRDGD
jgi:PAS domain S-box-containing protein